jgi:hypothetical protein
MENSAYVSQQLTPKDKKYTSRGGSSSSSSFQRQQKSSPTSVMEDLNNNNSQNSANVRWSHNLNQRPTSPRRGTLAAERPKSILRRKFSRKGGSEQLLSSSEDCPSDETTPREKSVRISDQPDDRGAFISDSPSAMGFVDLHGRALSPIPGSNNSAEEEDTNNEQGGMPKWMVEQQHNNPSFEKNIPEEFQRAFLKENAVRSSVWILLVSVVCKS